MAKQKQIGKKRGVFGILFTILAVIWLFNTVSAWGADQDGLTRETLSGRAAMEKAVTLTDEEAKKVILTAIGRGASVTFTYNASGQIIAYRAVVPDQVIPGEKKYWSQMTAAEKKAALKILQTSGNQPYAPPSKVIGGKTMELNEDLWYEKGILVYGSPFGESSSAGPRYWGYDINGGYYANDEFPRDSDSGRQPWEKEWWELSRVLTNDNAKRLIGSHALNNSFTTAAKRNTAAAFLGENPGWKNAGLDVNYILNHFFFNSVLTDGGLTNGQFIGVQENAGKLWYQVFSVEASEQQFTIVPGYIEEGEVLIWKDPGAGEIDGGDPTAPESEPGAEEQDMSAQAILEIPSRTYEGHTVSAKDKSLFTINNELWSAKRTYAAGKGSNRFSVAQNGGKLKRTSDIEAEITFSREGVYDVILKAIPKTGTADSDNKSVEVLKTPAILHSLTGVQKENRKQVLNIDVATNPDYPLRELWVELEDAESGEKVKLAHNMGAEENARSNSGLIKTRPIRALDSDEYFTSCKLEFLTKNEETRIFTYTIYAKDSRGYVNTVKKEFTVSPDCAPQASISAEPFYLRQENSDTAVITAADSTVTDGDRVKRGWKAAFLETGAGKELLPESLEQLSFGEAEKLKGFSDESMETGQQQEIRFLKDGVGAFVLRLEAADVWTEETLEEYVTEADYKKSVAYAVSEVENLAPRVSVTPIQTKKAEILLAGQKGEMQFLQDLKTNLKYTLAEKGIDARITAAETDAVPQGESEEMRERFLLEEPYGYEGAWTFLENSAYAADERRVYTVQASWPGSASGDEPEYPYTITAYDVHTGMKQWVYTISEGSGIAVDLSDFPVSGGSRLRTDADGRYLFFQYAEDRTLVLSAENGAYQTVLNFKPGEFLCLGEKAIYNFNREGIQRIDTKGGAVRILYSGRLYAEGARLRNGQAHCLAKRSDGVYRAVFNPLTESITLEPLHGMEGNRDAKEHALICVDSDGNLILRESDGSSDSIFMFNQKGVQTGAVRNAKAEAWKAVLNETGVCQYAAGVKRTKTSSYYRTHATVYDLKSGAVLSGSVKNSSDYPSAGNILYTQRQGNTVSVATGSIYTYVKSYGYNGYEERAYTFVFDLDKQECSVRKGGFIDLRSESSRCSDVSAAFHYDDNYPEQVNGSRTAVYTKKESEDMGLFRLSSKYLRNDGELTALLYLEPESRESAGEEPNAEARFMPLVSALLKDLGGSFFRIPRNLANADQIADGLTAGNNADRKVLSLKTENGEASGTLSKQYVFVPGETYYYEYDQKTEEGGALHTEITSAVQSLSGKNLPAVYYVEKIIAEDFNDKEINSYFTANAKGVLEGKYRVCDLSRKAKRNSNTDSVVEDTISFTIPSGKKAVLAFDYELKLPSDSPSWRQVYAKINGEQWSLFQEGNRVQTGTYFHQKILPEGENSITLYLRYYGTLPAECGLLIDNLRVIYLNESAPETDAAQEQTEIRDGWTHVSGSFSAPESILSYASLPGTYFKGTTEEAQQKGYLTKNKESYKDSVTFHIPEGESQLLTKVKVKSSGTERGTSAFWEGKQWLYEPRNSVPAGYHIENPFDLWLPRGLKGEQTIVGGGNAKASMRFEETELLRAAEESAALKAGMFFVEEDGTLLAAENVSNGAVNFAFRLKGANNQSSDVLPNGAAEPGVSGHPAVEMKEASALVKNLKIYTIRGGQKIYTAEEAFRTTPEISEWERKNLTAESVQDTKGEEQTHGAVYRKGEAVVYAVNYYDYEGDPSKKSYWKYTHTPFNDGAHPQAAVVLNSQGQVQSQTGIILDKPIPSFYVDGKYTVEHWQEDDTSRGKSGFPAYDKASVSQILTFYIDGEMKETAPKITSLKTDPAAVRDGNKWAAIVTVDDAEKDELRLDTEIYKNGTLVQTDRKTGIRAAGGVYPQQRIPARDLAAPGNYEIVCTVRDQSGAGIRSTRFTVVSQGSITGWVMHTDQWDINRKKFNIKNFGKEYNGASAFAEYKAASAPRQRGTNVFWSGERFVINAAVKGNPKSVSCEILNQGYRTALSAAGKTNAAGENIYSGVLWDKSMINKWGRKVPELLTFRFTAVYPDGTILRKDVSVIVDSADDYWLLHRLR